MKIFIQKVATILISFLFVVLILEIIVFRFILPAPSIPRNAFSDGIIKYLPNQTGFLWVKNDYRCLYRINRQGWNSKYDHYQLAKSTKRRIAIIGDSFVEGFTVDFDKSLAEQLEAKLGTDKYEVYRFGISGAPLSEYLQILRKEVVKYAPDYVVIVVVHNDFALSYESKPGRYTSSFLKLQIEGKTVKEVLPAPYEEGWFEYLIRSSAIFRFLHVGEQVDLRGLKKVVFPEKKRGNLPNYQGNIDVASLAEHRERDIIATEYIFKEIKELALQHKFQVLIIMDGDRQSIYQGKDAAPLYASGALSLNRLAAAAAKKVDLPFIDLQPIFAQNYRLHQKRFDYPHDAHWNEYGHQLAAETIYQYWFGHLFQGAKSGQP